MNKTTFVRDQQGNAIGSTRVNANTGITTLRDRHGNVLGYRDEKRGQTRSKNGNVLRRGDSSFLLRYGWPLRPDAGAAPEQNGG